MTLLDFFFSGFAFLLLLSALLAVSVRNPVHSVFFLIFAFINAAGIFVILGAEFVAMILVIVYVGAVAVLFLFVVMMLDVDFAKLKASFVRYLPVGIVFSLLLVAQLSVMTRFVPGAEKKLADIAQSDTSNAKAIGAMLYSDYVVALEAAGMILLLAMIGAIALTQTSRADVKRQVIAKQVGRSREDSVEKRKVKSGEGV